MMSHDRVGLVVCMVGRLVTEGFHRVGGGVWGIIEIGNREGRETSGLVLEMDFEAGEEIRDPDWLEVLGLRVLMLILLFAYFILVAFGYRGLKFFLVLNMLFNIVYYSIYVF
jgi:hypothetical protein